MLVSLNYSIIGARKDLFRLRRLHNLTLHYNELKRVVLRILSAGPKNSLSLVQELARHGVEPLEVHAVRMALVRYYKQGLLKRQRESGMFVYTLSERGLRRLKWLDSGETKTDHVS
jgi:DNA-binding PadR family transcriptional regulator